ncbi:MAG: N-acetylglucosamine kinase [Bacteroidota bacterium]|nr:N-acetylglucosamine kinase [Bacteroidota bacterium]
MILIVDSGSTKSDWIAIDSKTGNHFFKRQRTSGLNPAIISKFEAIDIINKNKIITNHRFRVEHVFFYGAGCGTAEASRMLKNVLKSIFSNAKVSVKEDTYAAVFSTIDSEASPAVVCILGTGSNCTYFDGKKAQQRVVSLGYSVMDDASGNYFGRQLLRDYYFDFMPHDFKLIFETRYNINADYIKKNLYKKPNPNAYLSKFAEFLVLNRESDYVQSVIKKGLRSFVRTMILQYEQEIKTVPVHFAGSIAFFLQEEIKEIAVEFGFKIGNFQRRPIEGLVDFHINRVTNN